MPGLSSAARVGGRVLHLTVTVVSAVPRLLIVAVSARRQDRRVRLSREIAGVIEQLGGAFLKAGQLLATRVDLVGADLAAALGRLHDDVKPMTARQALLTVTSAFDRVPVAIEAAVRTPPVASGSIACVYRVRHDGADVAVKVRRPDVARRFAADIAIVAFLTRAAARLPMLRRVPLVEIVDQVGMSLAAQMDFSREVEHLRRLRTDLADLPDIVVPAVLEEWSSGGVIAMEYVHGLDRASADQLPAETKEAGLSRLVRAVYHMLFVDGFIHVDLHQGNVYFRADGTVVILDAGFMFQLSDMARTRFTQFFAGMIRGDGEFCADILLSTVRHIEKDADVSAFKRDVTDLVARSTGAVAKDFELAAFSVELFDLQRRNRLFAEPEFVFPLLCLLSLEGAVRRLHPLMDFQLEAAPHVMHGLLLTDAVVT
ncbi:ABC1 kinase family protein [Nonomuraea sp. NPDC059194]|uniref:ABC1 kinase family protein n=1 Tax=Nonomuraea sp. NPDC059194 TaxID=3346764 RepID=UPI0036C97CC1